MKKLNSILWVGILLAAGLLAGCDASGSKTVSGAAEKTVWLTDYDAALKEAQATNKLVVIDFFATWCGPCKMMERDTFSDEKVQERLTEFVPLKIDVDQQSKLAAQFGIEAMPTTLVVDATGKPLAHAVGYLAAADYLAVLDKATTVGSKADAAK